MVLRLTRYITRQILMSCAVTAVVLITMIWTIQSFRYLTIILRSQESFGLFYRLILLALPDLLVIILPITLFIATLFVYNRFQSDRELVSIMASGYTRWQLARPTLVIALGMTCLVYMINIFVLPWAFKNMRDMEFAIKRSLPSVLVQEGIFNAMNGVTVYVNKKEGQILEGIIASVQRPQENFTFMAKEGRLVVEDQVPRIIMVNGNRQEYNPQKDTLTVLYFDKTIITLSEEVKPGLARPRKPVELDLVELLMGPHPNVTPAYRQRLYMEGYQRLLTPWNALVFTSIALAFILSSRFRRGSHFFVLVKATVAVILFQVATLSLINYGAHVSGAIVFAYGITIGVIGLCLFVLRRNKPFPFSLFGKRPA